MLSLLSLVSYHPVLCFPFQPRLMGYSTFLLSTQQADMEIHESIPRHHLGTLFFDISRSLPYRYFQERQASGDGAFMEALQVTDRDRSMAKICERCPICRHARGKQQGVAFRFVKTIENRICPFCQAYEKVHGRKAHERFLWRAPGLQSLSLPEITD
jgi:hypothetical protein